jgi:phage tail sheath gpL-like
MSAPLAVSPSNTAAGLWLTVDLKRTASSPGAQSLKCLLISPRATGAGDIVDDDEIREVFSADDVKTAIGRGLGYYAYKLLQLNNPQVSCKLVAPAESGGSAATAVLSFEGTPTAASSWAVYVKGVKIEVSWAVGDAATVARDDAVDAINEKVDEIPVTAAAGSGGKLTLSFNSKGPAGNDCRIRVAKTAGTGATLRIEGQTIGTIEESASTANPAAQPASAALMEVSFAVGWTGGNVTISGTDPTGDSVNEVFTASAGNTVRGTQLFSTVTASGGIANSSSDGTTDLATVVALLTESTLSGGTTEPDFTNALATVQGEEFDFIVPCVSNAEAASASGSSNVGLVETHVEALISGRSAKLQQSVIGCTSGHSSTAVCSVARNQENFEHPSAQLSESLPCELAAAEAGDRMRRRALKSNSNRIGSKLLGVKAAADIVTNNPTDTQIDSYQKQGVTVCYYTEGGDVRVCRPISGRSQDENGNPDRRVFDVNEVDAIYDLCKDLRTAIPQEFQDPDGNQVLITENWTSDSEDEPPPAGVVEVRDIKAFIDDRLTFWIDSGNIDGTAWRTAVNDGSFIVEINAADKTQVDVFLPAEALPVLAKIGLYVAKVA